MDEHVRWDATTDGVHGTTNSETIVITTRHKGLKVVIVGGGIGGITTTGTVLNRVKYKMTSDDATTDVINDTPTTGTVPNGTKHKGLKVIIAGGGIGGLTAAIALRRQGHHVDIYEPSDCDNEPGAAIHIPPNAMGVLEHIGIDPREGGAVPLLQVRNSVQQA